jgi:hypothetical protein
MSLKPIINAGDGVGEHPNERLEDYLDACRDDLAAALIALHEAVETSCEPWARELDAKIWQHLRASTQRRAMSTSPF